MNPNVEVLDPNESNRKTYLNMTDTETSKIKKRTRSELILPIFSLKMLRILIRNLVIK